MSLFPRKTRFLPSNVVVFRAAVGFDGHGQSPGGALLV